jgi:hypothetical protein
MIKLTHKQWLPVLDRIRAEYPASVWAISWKQREVLGFTVRNYREWPQQNRDRNDNVRWGRPEEGVYLDFWNDAQETFFSMKYLNL